MSITATGYQAYSGQALNVWASGNTAFFAALNADLTGLQDRIFYNEQDILSKVDEDTTFSNFATIQSTFRSQSNQRVSSLEAQMTQIINALTSIRRTLRSIDSRLDALES